MSDKNDAREFSGEDAKKWWMENAEGSPFKMSPERIWLHMERYAAAVTQERDALRQFLKWSRRNSYACLFWKETMGDSSPCERCAHCKMQKLGLRAAAEESQPK
jgi:hypothetical protein